jgi:hypothetical protein
MPGDLRQCGFLKNPPSLGLWCLLLGLLLVVVMLVATGWAVFLALGDWWAWRWVRPALVSGQFAKYGLVMLGSAVALAVLCGLLWRAGGSRRGWRGNQEGGAMIEFVMVLPIALMLVLIMAQSSLLMVGNLCVNYSAYCAARSAIVTIPDDLSPGEPPNYVDGRPDSSAKRRRILLAAAWAVLPVSCSIREQSEAGGLELMEGLEKFFKTYNRKPPGWIRAHLGRKLRYALDHTSVDLAPPENGDTYGPAEDIHVSVDHTFYLAVPYASGLFYKADRDGVELDIGTGEYGIVIRVACTLTNEGVQDYVDVEEFPVSQ